MMKGYPNDWNWTNGIQQERARMILPLAWLYRVEPTEQHKQWLEFMTEELLKNQVACGGIREELVMKQRVCLDALLRMMLMDVQRLRLSLRMAIR